MVAGTRENVTAINTPIAALSPRKASRHATCSKTLAKGTVAIMPPIPGAPTRMDVAIGMKLKRVDGEAVDDVVSITVGTAVVDADNAVVANDRIVYRAGIAKEDGLKYPVIDYRVTINSDHRLVISLLPAP